MPAASREQPKVCMTHRWRETVSNLQFRPDRVTEPVRDGIASIRTRTYRTVSTRVQDQSRRVHDAFDQQCRVAADMRCKIVRFGDHNVCRLFDPITAPRNRTTTLVDDVIYRPISFREKFGLFDEQWQPKVIAEMNDYQFKLVKLQGDFIWHDHKDTDETFIVIEGNLRIDFRDGSVNISAGEMFVVPKGVAHKPYAENEVKLLLIEPRGVVNTGDAGGERTAEDNVWI